ncbi:hypothetical protein ACQQ2N_12235 [Dokdonella sp. MW10]|uniref:hypothetical protein n=1 Tax=Dokdonella sp. MW10 TaxID=2992926 RepID=UPI003F819D0C
MGAIGAGLKRLLCLGLEGQPSAEVIAGTKAVWYDAVRRAGAWEAESAAPRIEAGFAKLCATARRWPAPADLLAAMPRSKPASTRFVADDLARELGMVTLSGIAAKLGITPDRSA